MKAVYHSMTAGGMTGAQLVRAANRHGVRITTRARQVIESDAFSTSKKAHPCRTTQFLVGAMFGSAGSPGNPQNWGDVLRRITMSGSLTLKPEVAVHYAFQASHEDLPVGDKYVMMMFPINDLVFTIERLANGWIELDAVDCRGAIGFQTWGITDMGTYVSDEIQIIPLSGKKYVPRVGVLTLMLGIHSGIDLSPWGLPGCKAYIEATERGLIDHRLVEGGSRHESYLTETGAEYVRWALESLKDVGAIATNEPH